MGLVDIMERACALLKKKSIEDFEVFGVFSDTVRAESNHGEVDFLNRSSESGIAEDESDEGVEALNVSLLLSVLSVCWPFKLSSALSVSILVACALGSCSSGV